MRIAYCSMLLPEEKKLAERTKKRLSGISLHKFTSAIIQGLDENIEEPISVFNIINTLNYPNFPQLIFKTEKWAHAANTQDCHIGYINLFGLKYITQEKKLYKKLKRWVNESDEKCIVCVHHIYYPMMKAAVRLKAQYGNKVVLCLITGDMVGEYGLQSQYKFNLKQMLLKRIDRKINQYAKEFDCFVFATKYMAEAFGVAHKPFVVLECAYLPKEDTHVNVQEDDDHKSIFYAGAVREEYGIPHLLRAFSQIKDERYRLYIAGDGNAVPTVKAYEEKDERIKFLGFLTPRQVDEYQALSTVLVSPRVADGYEFVKYSFPSKTMECLASGKPYIAHKLPCDPDEYANYIQYADNETDEALAEKIKNICELPASQRQTIGEKARKFVLTEKNPKAMTKRIVDMWKEMLHEKASIEGH